MVELLIAKLRVRDELSADEVAVLQQLPVATRTYARHERIVREGEEQTRSRLLVEGWAARAKTLPNGSRQITELHLPGDFMDLHSLLLKRLDHDVIALTPCTVADVEHARLKELTETHPHLTRLFWLSTLIDSAIHREALTLMGRANALQQLAHLLCELYVRHRVLGLTPEGRLAMPITQEDLADVCGLTPVHVNRVLQELRGTGLVESRGRTMIFPDLDALKKLAQFDARYLSLEREPR